MKNSLNKIYFKKFILPNFEIKFENDLSKSSSGILILIQGNDLCIKCMTILLLVHTIPSI